MLKRREQPSIHREIPFHVGTSWIQANYGLPGIQNYGLPGIQVGPGFKKQKKPGATPAKCLVSYLPLPIYFKAKGRAVEDSVPLVLQIGHGVTKSWAVEALGIVNIKQ